MVYFWVLFGGGHLENIRKIVGNLAGIDIFTKFAGKREKVTICIEVEFIML